LSAGTCHCTVLYLRTNIPKVTADFNFLGEEYDTQGIWFGYREGKRGTVIFV
jgi:hypothetical protein